MRGGFQTVEFNVYGWSALIASGAVLGAIVAGVSHIAWWIALPIGVVLMWMVLLTLDHRRFRNSMVHLGDSRLDAERGATIVARLQDIGITATYREYVFDEEEGGGVQRGILCRQNDVQTVQQVMAERLA